jgi:hypothetical protein
MATENDSLKITITGPKPLARLVPLTAPENETEKDYWRRKALERSLRIAELERVVQNLRDAVAEYEAET